ncbi:MAG: RHS repeat-associated core domain-containing protein [Betaproteobacteria bacterium]|nr:MAG: RHS repeat-associated core domain-containing protein [Betaproteobacteria bacterium]
MTWAERELSLVNPMRQLDARERYRCIGERFETRHGSAAAFVSPSTHQNLLRRYAHGPGIDEPIVWYEGSGLTDKRWLHPDERGSIVAWSNATAAATVYRYGTFGEPAGNDFSGSRFRYTGQIALPEAKLYHYKARVYDPTLGRFLQTDPICYEEDLNPYTYTRSDPLNLFDPTGMFTNCAEYADAGGSGCTDITDEDGNVTGLRLTEMPTKNLMDQHFTSNDALDVHITAAAFSMSGINIKNSAAVKSALEKLAVGDTADVEASGIENLHVRELGVIGQANVSIKGNLRLDDKYGSFTFQGEARLSGADKYNYEMHSGATPWIKFRNFLTWAGKPGPGTAFNIHMIGAKPVTIRHIAPESTMPNPLK